MKTFKDFIVARFGINEESGYQMMVSNPEMENINHDLTDIFNYMFQNYKNDVLKTLQTFISNHRDDGVLQNKWENITSKFDVLTSNKIVDNPLGNLQGMADKKPDLKPNEQSNY